jgi:hypothetical protein
MSEGRRPRNGKLSSSAFSPARDTWKRLLQGKLDPGWRHAAETHQAAVEKILSERKRAERNDLFTCGNIAMLVG